MAAQIFPYGTALTVVWHLSKPDGTDFDITGYTSRVYYRTGNKETEVNGTHLTASGNTLSIVIPATEPSAPGEYALRLVLYQNNRLFCTLNYNAAFVLSRRLAQGLAMETQQEEMRVVHLYTVAEFYLFTPVIPTVGSDGYWYVNGTKVTDGHGEFVPSSHTMEYDAQTNYIIIDRDRVDSQGHSISQTITSLADALSTAAQDHETAQEDHSTAAGDHQTAAADHSTATRDHQTIVDMIDLYEPITINGDVTNAPDEEDITSDENDLLKFKDRGVIYGMGYCILRRNKTFAEQVTKVNTIYEIRYDFDLGGGSVTIPAGCTLKFVGGKLSNGTITLNNTNIEAAPYKIFNDIQFGYSSSSNLCSGKVFLDWFDDTDMYGSLAQAVKIARTLVCSGKNYEFASMPVQNHIVADHDLVIEGNGSSFVLTSTAFDLVNNCTFLTNKKRLEVKDLNFEVLTSSQSRMDGSSSVALQVMLFGSGYNLNTYGSDQSVLFDNVNVHTPYGDSGIANLYNAYLGTDFVFRNCTFKQDTANALDAGGAFAWFQLGKDSHKEVNVIIDGCDIICAGADESIALNTISSGSIPENKKVIAHITNTKIRRIYNGATAPSSGAIDVVTQRTEATSKRVTWDVFIDNCSFDGSSVCKRMLVVNSSVTANSYTNVYVSNSTFEYSGTSPFDISNISNGDGILDFSTRDFSSGSASNVVLSGCTFSAKYILASTGIRASVRFQDCAITCDSLNGATAVDTRNNGTDIVFSNCKMSFVNTRHSCSVFNLSFLNCSVFAPTNDMRFNMNGYPVIKELYGTTLNGLKLPEIDTLSINVSSGPNGADSSGMSSFAQTDSVNVVASWYNNTGSSAVFSALGKETTVEAGGYLLQIGVYRADEAPCYFAYSINGEVRYAWFGTLEQYNNPSVWKAFKRGTSSARPTGIASTFSVRGGNLHPALDIGYEYYDTTLGKPIYASAINASTGVVTWVDATGATVE